MRHSEARFRHEALCGNGMVCCAPVTLSVDGEIETVLRSSNRLPCSFWPRSRLDRERSIEVHCATKAVSFQERSDIAVHEVSQEQGMYHMSWNHRERRTVESVNVAIDLDFNVSNSN